MSNYSFTIPFENKIIGNNNSDFYFDNIDSYIKTHDEEIEYIFGQESNIYTTFTGNPEIQTNSSRISLYRPDNIYSNIYLTENYKKLLYDEEIEHISNTTLTYLENNGGLLHTDWSFSFYFNSAHNKGFIDDCVNDNGWQLFGPNGVKTRLYKRSILRTDFLNLNFYLNQEGLYEENMFNLIYSEFPVNTWHKVEIKYNFKTNEISIYFNNSLIKSVIANDQLSIYSQNYYKENNMYNKFLNIVFEGADANIYTENNIQKVYKYACYVGYIADINFTIYDTTDSLYRLIPVERITKDIIFTNKSNNTFIVNGNKTVNDIGNIIDMVYNRKIFKNAISSYNANNKNYPIELFKKDITFSEWVCLTDYNSNYDYNIISIIGSYKFNNVDNSDKIPFIRLYYKNGYVYLMYLYTKHDLIYKYDDIITDNEVFKPSIIKLELNDIKNKWIHIAFTYKKNKLFMYINGNLIGNIDIQEDLTKYLYYVMINGGNNTDLNQYCFTYFRNILLDTTKAIYNGDIIKDKIYKNVDIFYCDLLLLSNIVDTNSESENLLKYDNYNMEWKYKSNNKLDLNYVDNIQTFDAEKYQPFEIAPKFNGFVGLYEDMSYYLFNNNLTITGWFKNESTDSSEKSILRFATNHVNENIKLSKALAIELVSSGKNNIELRLMQYSSYNETERIGECLNSIEYTIDEEVINKWNHFAIFYINNSRTIKLYINGELVESQILSIDISKYLYYIWVGMTFKTNNTNNYIGYLRNIIIKNYILIDKNSVKMDVEITNKLNIDRYISQIRSSSNDINRVIEWPLKIIAYSMNLR